MPDIDAEVPARNVEPVLVFPVLASSFDVSAWI
jgi:hypothetical protein